ncbi:DUF2505 domain-containing protein [Brevibacterium album]|uniref:DUF2505 domain-containing protein n=1 Tax=Brevibacterium album TaxID=417948 RepID=UPI00048AC885|nr:DUF2505 domain-containing protein [Brevibacterium album]
MKEFSLTVDSPRTPAAVRSALLSPQSWEARGALSAEADAGGLTAVLPLRADQLPEAARRFAAGDASLRVRIDGDAEAAPAAPLNLMLTVPGAPVEVRVALTVRPGAEAEHSVLDAQAQVVSSVPLMGGMIESALEPFVRQHLAEQLHEIAHLG